MTDSFWVGRVRFDAQSHSVVLCAACKRNLPRALAATHAREKHRGLAEGVLPGQMGLPFTRTPDVPR